MPQYVLGDFSPLGIKQAWTNSCSDINKKMITTNIKEDKVSINEKLGHCFFFTEHVYLSKFIGLTLTITKTYNFIQGRHCSLSS